MAAALPVLSAPLRRATGHNVELRLDNTTVAFARLYCPLLDILVEEEGRTKVRASDRRGRWILEGWVQGSLAERGSSCGPRVIQRRRQYSTSSDGTERPPPPEVPPGYIRYVPLDPAPRLAGPVWLARRRRAGEAVECQRWQFRSTSSGVVLERHYRESYGSGRAVMREFQPLHGGPLTFEMYDIGYQRRWIRRPRPDEGHPGLRGPCSAIFPLTIVRADAERIGWIQAGIVLAYHPDDVQLWFLTEQACAASLAPESIVSH